MVYPSHEKVLCNEHGMLLRQCRCPAPDKYVRREPCTVPELHTKQIAEQKSQGTQPSTDAAEDESDDLYTIAEVKAVVESEGLLYAVRDGVSPERIDSRTLRDAWVEAREALARVQRILDRG